MITNQRRPVTHVDVIGSGPIARIAALALRRALPMARVTLALGAAAASDEPIVLLPGAVAQFEALGFAADALIGAGIASWRIGERVLGWSDKPFTLVSGDGLTSIAGVAASALSRHLGKAGLEGDGPGERLIAAGRYAPGYEDRSALLEAIDPALRIHAARLSALLDRDLHRAGIGPDDGSTAADLVVEIAGECGAVARARALPPSNEPAQCSLLADAYDRTPGGFRYSWVDVDGRQAGRSYEDAAPKSSIIAAKRESCWTEDRIVIDAMLTSTGALFGLGPSLAIWQIATMIELMPGAAHDRLLAAEYDRRMAAVAEDAMAFATTPDAIVRQRDHDQPLPAAVDRAVASFLRYGKVQPPGESLVGAGMWMQLLAGLGLVPQRPDPFVLSLPVDAARPALVALERQIAALPALLPDYKLWLAGQRDRGLSG